MRFELSQEVPLPSPAGDVLPAKSFRPARDTQGGLHSSVKPLAGETTCLAGESFRGTRTVWLDDPRVEEVSCGPSPQGVSTTVLVGLDGDGVTRWRRKLGFASGGHVLDERVIGARRLGLVLNTLAVLSPGDGKELLAPRLRLVGTEARAVPEKNVEGPALYLPVGKAVLYFAAEASLRKAEGGLWLFQPASGQSELVRPVRKVSMGAFWRVEDMLLSDDGTHLFLAEKLGERGAGGVALSVLAWPSGAPIQDLPLGGTHFCRDPRLVEKPGGEVTLAYRDETAGASVQADFRPAVR